MNPMQRQLKKKPGVIDVHTHVGINLPAYVSLSYPYALSVEDLLIRMKLAGIDYSVVFPYGSPYYSAKSFVAGKAQRDPQTLSALPFERANRSLCREVYEIFPEARQRLLPFAMFDPSRKPSAQATFLRSLSQDYRIYGLKTVTSYNRSYIRDLWGKGRALVDFAAERDLPLLLHCAVHPEDPWANVFDILRLARERSDVRLCIAHSCRFDQRALAEAHRLPNCFVDLSAFHIHCQLARQNHPAIAPKKVRFKADYRRPLTVMRKLAQTYPGTILWGTDTPAYYWFGTFLDAAGKEMTARLPCKSDTEAKALQRLSRRMITEIAGQNTLRFLFG